MTKKGGIQQLQAEIQSDEELDKFLEREGLLVLDVYAAWCGPCTGMLGALKKAKLEIGGDNLHLAICKSDTVEKLKRFRNKSEPIWLFCYHKKIVNILFGCNVPRLLAIIIAELKLEEKYLAGDAERTFYEFDELMPEEKERQALVFAEEEEIDRLEFDQAIEQRQDFIRNVTGKVMDHVNDMGVTIFSPHVMKEAYRKSADVADKMELILKDRKCVKIKPEMLEVLHFEIENPLSDEVLEYFYPREILIFLWKLGENETRETEEALTTFVKSIAYPIPVLDEHGEINPNKKMKPSILEAIEIVPGEEVVPPQKPDRKFSIHPQQPIDKKEAVNVSDKPKVKVIAAWTPQNKRATAAFLYIFFRNHLDHFLPADPPPVPQHLCFVFDAYKRNNILDSCKNVIEDILAYGFFSSDDLTTCTLLAKSNDKYELLKPTVLDKIILKVAKKRSNIVQILKTLGPSYVSPNTVVGKQDCLNLFPDDYNVELEEPEDDTVEDGEENGKKKKRKKKKKKRRQSEIDTSEQNGEVSIESDETLDDISDEEEDTDPKDEKSENIEEDPKPAPNP